MATKFTRRVALLLSVLILMSSFGVTAAAADGSVTGNGKTSLTTEAIQNAKDLLETPSYDDYLKGYTDANGNLPYASESVTVKGTDYDAQNSTATIEKVTFDGIEAANTGDSGVITYKVNVPASGMYSIKVKYWPTEGKAASIQRIFKINGEVPFSEAYYITLTKVWSAIYDAADKNTVSSAVDSSLADRFFKTDDSWKSSGKLGNEIRPSIVQTPEWREYSLKDVDGFYKDNFVFYFEKGENSISFEGVSQSMAIGSVTLCPLENISSYNDYKAKYEGVASGKDKIYIEGELTYRTSANTIYPVEDRSSAATSPSDPSRTLLNTIGGEKWQTSGQWISYQFTVGTSGMYSIVPRFRQNINDGIYSSRTLSIYSGSGVNPGDLGYYNGIPFDEARELRFDYDSGWQTKPLQYAVLTTNAKGETVKEAVDVEFYFEAGVVYTIEFEVSLGTLGNIVRDVQASLDVINDCYLNIMKLTGSNPDEYRDYKFMTVMPETIIKLAQQSAELARIASELDALSGGSSPNVATLEKISNLLKKMSSNEDEIAKNLEQLKSNIGSLGTWVSDAKVQPLQFDYIVIQGAEEKAPKANAGFFRSLWHELVSFYYSFVRDYNNMGASEESGADAVKGSAEVWLNAGTYGRDQTQVIRNLVNNKFTPSSGISVDLKLVTAGTLLPSILADKGPDVYIGLSDGDVINYAIRGALKNIETFDGFDKVTSENFNDAAMFVLKIDDADGVNHCYGLPETQSFPMMFIRTDILSSLGITTLDTWDDLLQAATVLSENNMQIGLSTDYKIFLYQMGGELFADGGMRINLDSNLALDSFETMCDMFTDYSFPYKYDFANRFRTGEMPIGIASYHSTYNQLIVFATELRGVWEFVPLPGFKTVDEDGNTVINNQSVSTVTAVVMVSECEDENSAWEFMKWYSGAECQVDYADEMVAILGDSAKHGTANRNALESMPWTREEYRKLSAQFENLASIPNYPGAYIIGRYTNFAFLAAYNDGEDPVEDLLSRIPYINKEITRKREEFGLETLESGQTLASKRRDQILAELEALSDADKATYSAQIAALKAAIENIDSYKAYTPDSQIDALRSAGDALKAANADLFASICAKITTCAEAIKSYQKSYPQN